MLGTLQCLPPLLIHLTNKNIPSLRLDRFTLLARLGVLVGSDSSIDRACEPHAEVDADPVVDGFVEGFGVGGEVKISEKTEGAEGEGEDGRDDALEEPGGEEYCSISAELQSVFCQHSFLLVLYDDLVLTVTTISNKCG